MKKAIILHGTYGSPNGNWFPWLKTKLEKLGIKVSSPTFPTPENQTIENWINILDKATGEYDKDTILIGHSSSPLVICAKLQQLDNPIRAVFFAAPFLGEIGNKDYDQANYNFNHYNFDWKKVKKGAKKFYIYRGDNDPYVPNELGKIIADNLKTKEIIIPNGGHLNSESGYTKFELLLEDIKTELNF